MSRTHLDEAINALRAGEVQVPVDLKNFSYDELRELVVEGLGEKAFRAGQLFEWLYKHRADEFDDMTNLSKSLRNGLRGLARTSALKPKGAYEAADGTTKLTFECDDGAVIESVFIPFDNHNSLCISSQVGCAMGCTFCYTAKMGLSRHLTTGEIVDQVVRARNFAAERGETISNIVFMGMGEPLHNLDAVVRACDILTDAHGLDFSRRRITVSTSGLVPQMEAFMERANVQLAVSLNASNDVQRSKIMPVNDRYDLDALMGSLRALPLERRQRITFEYVLLKDFNDSIEDAQRVIELTRGIPSKINIIPFNPHPATPFDTPTEEAIQRFQQYLLDRDVACFRRKTRGRDSMAACGQLGEPSKGKEPRHLRKRLENLHKELG
ncbi:MAG: 23S rRNA (adenine(2503)-C(2))-methyltransferase RlmN [bacterium]